ncbi:hypothetical protein BCR43DRAFT_551351 [Syncephalastrum racemosum]|uniref:Uncharacterized protein n=1 Tax=Syncephalastrum racemosum TaxID=13706 RepID=A0A1X2H5H5_SYNRA|nr:hypothetical protein BCR43DRAFT_551351 [Syncephalastrum racemosum]
MKEIVEVGMELVKANKLELAKKLSTEYSTHIVKILLTVVHDKIEPQATLCLRHFIDFVHQTAAEEHSEETLKSMQKSLQMYNEHSAIMAKYSKMAKYLSRRDALLDGTEKANNRKVDAIEASLGAPLNNGKPIPISRSLMRQIRVCLDTEIEGRKATRNVKNMPKPTYNSAIFYTTLKIPVLTDDDGELYLEKLRASPNYRGNEWMDYAEIEGGYYGRILQFFRIKYRDWDLDLCLLEPYVVIQDMPHITGMEVLQPYSGPARERTKVTCTRNIKRQVHIMPDFATFQDEYGYHTQYLLNHDINPQSWAENKGLLLDLQEEIITWEKLAEDGMFT